jgi:hypothetical protein
VKTRLFASLLGVIIACAPFAAHAHRAWMLPSATVLSGDDPWISIDAASSNVLFYADHNPMRLDDLVIIAPDGSQAAPQNMLRGRYRSTFDVQLTQAGTYRIANVTRGANARYTVNGEERRWRGQLAELQAALPAGATNVQITETNNRVETFVTRGAPTAIRPTNVGLELIPVTHPSDFVVDEPTRVRLQLDGRPAANVQVTLAPGNQRYRNDTGEFTVTTDAQGVATITWPAAGMWWINASIRDLPSQTPNATRSAAYSGVLEVLP